MKAATKIISSLRKKGVELEVKGIYSIKALEKNVDYLDEETIQVDGSKKAPKDVFSVKIPIDYVLLSIKMEQLFPELKLDGDLDFEVRVDNSVKVRSSLYYNFPIDDKVTIGSYFKKFGSKIDFI